MIKRQQQYVLLPGMSIEDMEQEAIEFIRETCGESANVGVGFSGGKDSVVTLELMKRSGITFTSFYHATQIDPPELVKFIRNHHQGVTFFYPRQPFFKKIVSFAPPLPTARWCCGVLKHDDTRTKVFNPMVLGIRAEESRNRAQYHRWESRPRQTAVYPILHWNMAHVWEYIEWRQLPYCEEIAAELRRACRKFKPFNSAHEGYAVILEELDELWNEIKKRPCERRSDLMKNEAIQVVAMAVRFVIDVIWPLEDKTAEKE